MYSARTCWLVVVVFWSHVCGAQTGLKFYSWSEDLSPIVTLENGTNGWQASGIAVDVLHSWSYVQRYGIEYLLHNRTRGVRALYSGEVDITILSREWLEKPDNVLFSLPIYLHKEYLYANTERQTAPLDELVQGAYICARRGYRYPVLQSYFDNKEAIRIDSHNELALFGMLVKGRCDFVVSNEFIAENIIARQGWQKQIKAMEPPFNEVNFTLALYSGHADILDSLNAHITQLVESGELDKIIQHHRSLVLVQP